MHVPDSAHELPRRTSKILWKYPLDDPSARHAKYGIAASKKIDKERAQSARASSQAWHDCNSQERDAPLYSQTAPGQRPVLDQRSAGKTDKGLLQKAA